MEIRNGIAGLGSLLGMGATDAAVERGENHEASVSNALGADHATLSTAASELAQSGDSGVRMEKVSSIQSALAEGIYSVPASAVASKVVDSMLGSK